MTQRQWSLVLRKWLYITCASGVLIFIGLWISRIAPELKKMPGDFTYSANILSIDNLYDESAKKFQGEHISKTTFSYHIVDRSNQFYIIENKFAVRTLNDVPIILVKRTYSVDPYTWQHVPAPNQQERKGFLFGPQYANGQDYSYWHINYNNQATLKFVNKEYIDGLEVYHYQDKYTADQTQDLSDLPGVPEKRGIKTNVHLELWIEPISGWMVKYKDNSLAYYYDKKTGAIISPWNQFSNRYTLNSVREQVATARYLKRRILIIDYSIPCILSVLAILLFCFAFQIKIINLTRINTFWSQYKERFLRHSLSFIVFILGLFTLYYFYIYSKKPTFYTIGISQWSNNSDLTETIKGFKTGLESSGYIEGVNLRYNISKSNPNIEKQISILQSFLDQDVDLLFALTTPVTLVAKGITSKTPIVFSDVIYPDESNIISPPKTSQRNLVGIRNYIPPAKQYNAFEKLFGHTKALGFIHKKGDPDSEFQYYEYQKLLSNRGIKVVDIPAIDIDDLNRQLMRKDLNYNALFLACDTLIQEGATQVVADHCNKNKIPNFTCDKSSIHNGLLMGVVADPGTVGYMAGKQAALILDGAKPEWLHTEAPERGILIINESSAKLLGIEIPTELKNKADYIIHGNQ